MSKKKAIGILLIFILLGLLLVGGIVWFFDPFYLYHDSFIGEASLYDSDNQMAGTVRNFEYDSILVGSSTAENFNTDYLNLTYDCVTLKVIKRSGSVGNLMYYVREAEKTHDLKNVFWCLDLFSLCQETEVTLFEDGMDCIYTATPFDDIHYLFNKDVLFKEIPKSVVGIYKGENTKGNAYCWAYEKTFSKEAAIAYYQRPEGDLYCLPQAEPSDEYKALIAENISLITDFIDRNPETHFIFIFPPYSMLWWDSAYINGEEEKNMYLLETVLTALISRDNAEVFFFQDEESVVCNLNNYMDLIHYSADISEWILNELPNETHKVNHDNCIKVTESMRRLSEKIHAELIYEYY